MKHLKSVSDTIAPTLAEVRTLAWMCLDGEQVTLTMAHLPTSLQ